jgi:hypothetical protein
VGEIDCGPTTLDLEGALCCLPLCMSNYDQGYRHRRTNRNRDHCGTRDYGWVANWPLGKGNENLSDPCRSTNPGGLGMGGWAVFVFGTQRSTRIGPVSDTG